MKRRESLKQNLVQVYRAPGNSPRRDYNAQRTEG